jgi:hypothetical protein
MVQSTTPQSPLRRVAHVFVGGMAAVAIYAGLGIGPADAGGQHRILARTTFDSGESSANPVVQEPATTHSATAMATGPTTTTTTPRRASLTDYMEMPLP